MKLTLSHADLSLALCEFLANRGMTAFDPAQVSAEFSFKRGTKELVCELDSEPKAAVPQPVVTQASATVTASSVAPVETPELEVSAAVPVVEPQVIPASDEATAAPTSDDNLFD